jgi:hypothetical protein
MQGSDDHTGLRMKSYRSRDRSNGMATRLRAGQPKSRDSIPGRGKRTSFLKDCTGSGAHPAFYTMGTGGCFPWSKAAGA